MNNLANKLLKFMEKNAEQCLVAFPHYKFFPKNCCEPVSFMLKFLIEEACPENRPTVVKGYNHENNEYHFWVEVGACVYDLTSHQFDGIHPIIGESFYPLRERFPDNEIVTSTELLNNEDFLAIARVMDEQGL